MNETQLQRLSELAHGATPGPWVMQEPGESDPGAGTIYIDTHAYSEGPEPVVAPSYPLGKADAEYIAALDPATVLDLIAAARGVVVARLRAEFVRALTVDGPTKDRRRREHNQAIFNAKGGWQVFNDTDLAMVMEKFDRATALTEKGA